MFEVFAHHRQLWQFETYLRRMKVSNLRPDRAMMDVAVEAFRALVAASSRAGDKNEGAVAFAKMRALIESFERDWDLAADTRTELAFIEAATEQDNWDEAKAAFDRLDTPSLAAYRPLVSLLERRGDLEQLTALLETMRSRKLPLVPDEPLYASVLRTLEKAKGLSVAQATSESKQKELLRALIDAGVSRPDLNLFHALLHLCWAGAPVGDPTVSIPALCKPLYSLTFLCLAAAAHGVMGGVHRAERQDLRDPAGGLP
jgi:hypothetical protein